LARVRRALIAAGAVLGILGAGFGAADPAPAPDPAPVTLRFVTFNLLHGGIFSELTGENDGLEERLRLAVEGLRALDADVVGLQEASTGRRRGNVPARLAAALGYHYVHAPASTRPLGSDHLRRAVASVLGFAEGPALLSRFPIARWRAYELPRCGRPFDVRVVVFAELETPAGPVAAFSAHTSGDACHARAVADLVRASAGPLPAVVMGDLNAPATSPALRFLTHEAGFIDAFGVANPAVSGYTDGQNVRATQSTTGQRIDYVLLAAGGRVSGRVAASRLVLDQPTGPGPVRWASDHYGVLAEITFDGAAPSRVAGSRPVEDADRRLGSTR
jgi:endonuclease/exonuclease/phosphatase family metal-dependent hydrolase